jgi:hypothetical protein
MKMNIDSVIEKIEEKSEDHSLPGRVRGVLKAAIKELQNKDSDQDMRVTTAIYDIDAVVNDINIPMYAKTALWNIISDLEGIKRG